MIRVMAQFPYPNMNYAYRDELSIVPYIKNEIVAIAPTHDSPIIFLNSPNYTISEKFVLIKVHVDGLHFYRCT